jgi:signal recognition particle receptor subunit beta
MALVNHAKKEINAKIVYFGPAQSGKSTALTYIYSRIKHSLRGEFKCFPAGADNLIFFDFSPFETTLPNGYRLRLHIYTLTGTVTNPATWKMTLKGADGIMIMIDPTAEHTAETTESVSQLRDFLSAYGVGLHETPAVLQLNSNTQNILPDAAAQIAAALDLSSFLICQTNAASGDGLLEALTMLSRQILDRVTLCNGSPEADSAPAEPSSEGKPPEALEQHVTTPWNTPHSDDSPKVALLPHEIISEGAAIRIPMEISQSGVLRRLVVTVNVALE